MGRSKQAVRIVLHVIEKSFAPQNKFDKQRKEFCCFSIWTCTKMQPSLSASVQVSTASQLFCDGNKIFGWIANPLLNSSKTCRSWLFMKSRRRCLFMNLLFNKVAFIATYRRKDLYVSLNFKSEQTPEMSVRYCRNQNFLAIGKATCTVPGNITCLRQSRYS